MRSRVRGCGASLPNLLSLLLLHPAPLVGVGHPGGALSSPTWMRRLCARGHSRQLHTRRSCRRRGG